MELVRGIPITEYCDKHRLSTRERLELLVMVCRAVQHAHQKGIIHRDLKPTNVLVTVIDGRPIPKVIDFGVAKAIGGKLTEQTVYTQFAQTIGTPLYMSPEQAKMSGVDVDKSAVQANAARFHFVTREESDKVMGTCPNAEWRLLFALSRYGGLRCPSEHLSLRWGDVDWEHGRMTVRSPKTEHHVGGESRVVPLFPELRPHLEEVFDAAEVGTEFVITRYRSTNANLRTQFLRIVRRAGVQTWQKPFQNLRSTRETELAEEYPLHVVTAWLGNSQPVAAKHYLQVTDDHFSKAVQNPVQQAAEPRRIGMNDSSDAHEKPPVLQGSASQCDYLQKQQAPRVGLEPTT
jgi:hypothetical protein